MSYCRFSSNSFRCDVYTYEDCRGEYTTHVAGNRHIFGPIPHIPWKYMHKPKASFDAKKKSLVWDGAIDKIIHRILSNPWWWSYKLHMLSVRIIPRKPIGLKYDGETFNDPTPGECAKTLSYLKGLGYRVPQHAIDRLLEEENIAPH